VIIFAWFWGLFFAVLWSTPLCGLTYALDSLTWSYTLDSIGAYMPYVDVIVNGAQNICGAVLYALTIINMKILVRIIQLLKLKKLI
jgi:hypothetical protein